MKYIDLSLCRQLVEHQSYTPGANPDSFGQPQPSYTTTGTHYASIETGIGREFQLADNTQTVATNPVTVTLRYCGVSDPITPLDRLVLGSRVFEVVSVNNVENRNYAYRLLCTEVTG